MPFTDDVLDRALDAIGRIGRFVLLPWGGAEACVDTLDTAIRALTDAQLGIARAVEVDSLRAALAASAEMTRDLGATQLSGLRWILDV